MRQNRVQHIFRIAVVIVVIAAALTSYGCAREDTRSWKVFKFDGVSNPYGITFVTGQKSYNTNKTKSVTAVLTNTGYEKIQVGAPFTLVKKVGSVWKVVPMDAVFPSYIAILNVGDTHSYTLTQDLLKTSLTSGTYRIVTTAYIVRTLIIDDFENDESRTETHLEKAEVFAEFKLK